MAKREKIVNPTESHHNGSVVSPMGLTADEIEVGSFCCNWDPTDPELARLLFLAEVPSEQKSNDLVGVDFDIVYWICAKIEIPDRQNGGKTRVVRTTLIGPDDSILSTLSHGIVKSMNLMRMTFGDMPYNPPISVTVKGASVGTGSDMLMLVPKALEAKK